MFAWPSPFAVSPIGLLVMMAFWLVPLLAGYVVIRLAVRHGVMDARRRLRVEEASYD